MLRTACIAFKEHLWLKCFMRIRYTVAYMLAHAWCFPFKRKKLLMSMERDWKGVKELCCFLVSISILMRACSVTQSCLTLCDPTNCNPPGSPLSMGFSRQEYWSGLPFPTPGDLPDPGIEPVSLSSPALVGRFFTTVPPEKYYLTIIYHVHALLKSRNVKFTHWRLRNKGDWPE